MNVKKFGSVMTSPMCIRPSDRPYAIPQSNAPVFVWREVAWRVAFTTEMLTNTKSIYMHSLDMLKNAERREKERKRKQKKKRRRLSKIQRETVRKLE